MKVFSNYYILFIFVIICISQSKGFIINEDRNISDILIIYDDMDFELGAFNIKNSGSSAGHNGIKDIINKLKTENIARVRIGISKNNHDVVDYVLGKFSQEESKVETLFSKNSPHQDDTL